MLLGDLTTVGLALGSCNSELSLTTGSLQVTVLVGRSGSVSLFTSAGHVMMGGWLSRTSQMKTFMFVTLFVLNTRHFTVSPTQISLRPRFRAKNDIEVEYNGEYKDGY